MIKSFEIPWDNNTKDNEGGHEGLPFSEIFGRVGGDFRGAGYSRGTGNIYYFFAREYGWTKDQVDSQPIGYLNTIISEYKDEQRKERVNLNRSK